MAVAQLSPALDLRARRDRLFEVHSVLRAMDGLRPDEAFDELVKLYSVWLALGPVGVDAARRAESSLSLTDETFALATEMLVPVFVEQRRDTGADLFQELADVGVRAGLGQYFTPAPVARAMATYLRPRAGETWADPFCGSGLLFGELAAASDGELRLFGVDRDARVLRLARLEAAVHHPSSPLALVCQNALAPLDELRAALGAPPDGFDGVVTNPPFGAEIHDLDRAGYDDFVLARPKPTPLEILGLERSVQLLRPGGRMGVVLPQSILSNRGCRDVRRFLLDACDVDGVLSLPPETFAPFRGVGKAAIVFATKRRGRVRPPRTTVAVSRSVGWDGTGRAHGDCDVIEIAAAMRRRPGATVTSVSEMERNMTPEWHLRPVAEGVPLHELCDTIFSGRTPGRAAYVAAERAEPERVYRVLKVGDLTDHGIDWTPGERSHAAMPKPVVTKLLQLDDIALTAAAHHPRYIGAKIDVVVDLAAGYEERTFPAAEVMVLRPDAAKVHPVQLLLWLRSDEGRQALRSCVTGQTAHLYAADVGEIVVPQAVVDSPQPDAIELVERSLQLRRASLQAAAAAERAFAGALSAR